MKTTYLDYAHGLHQSYVIGKYCSSEESLEVVKQRLKKTMNLENNEFLSLSQNFSTSLIYVLRKIFQKSHAY